VDVNVHPTKREVHFLNEDLITERISDSLQEKLAGQSHSRAFEYQVEPFYLPLPIIVLTLLARLYSPVGQRSPIMAARKGRGKNGNELRTTRTLREVLRLHQLVSGIHGLGLG
jgi:hypothetical protein